MRSGSACRYNEFCNARLLSPLRHTEHRRDDQQHPDRAAGVQTQHQHTRDDLAYGADDEPTPNRVASTGGRRDGDGQQEHRQLHESRLGGRESAALLHPLSEAVEEGAGDDVRDQGSPISGEQGCVAAEDSQVDEGFGGPQLTPGERDGRRGCNGEEVQRPNAQDHEEQQQGDEHCCEQTDAGEVETRRDASVAAGASRTTGLDVRGLRQP